MEEMIMQSAMVELDLWKIFAESRHANSNIFLATVIGVWIAARSIVTNNITCKEHSVLLTNSVATNNLEPYNIYRGNPAKSIKKRKK